MQANRRVDCFFQAQSQCNHLLAPWGAWRQHATAFQVKRHHKRTCRASPPNTPCSSTSAALQATQIIVNGSEQLCSKPCSCAGSWQLGQLATPDALLRLWQENTLPECLKAWEAFSQKVLILGQIPPASSTSVVFKQVQECLLLLDAVLGMCQQVLLVTGLIKDHHSSQLWKAAAAAVFVEARNLEQAVCSDRQVHFALMSCQQLLQIPLHNHARSIQPDLSGADDASVQPADSPTTTGSYTSSSSNSNGVDNILHSNQLPLLADNLMHHVQTESLSPFRSIGKNSTAAQVLSLQDQQSIMQDLQAEQKMLVSNIEAILFAPAAAPTFNLDSCSAHMLLDPVVSQLSPALLQANPQLAAAAQSLAAVEGPEVTLQLDLQTVRQLLELHPEEDIRQEVYSTGILQRLDAMLLQWQDLSEVRRKIGRMHEWDSYADFTLHDSLLRSPAAAVSFCHQLIAALQPGAKASIQRLLSQDAAVTGKAQQQSVQDPSKLQPASEPQPQPQIDGGNLNALVYQDWQRILPVEDLAQLQEYLSLPKVMAGLGTILQASLGLSLEPRQPKPEEIWHAGVQVFELLYTDTCSVPQPREDTDCSSSRSDGRKKVVLGTVYLDLDEGYATQLLHYGCKERSGTGKQAGSSSTYATTVDTPARDELAGTDASKGQQPPAVRSDPSIALGSSNDGGCSHSSAGSFDCCGTRPAVAVGLQSKGVLWGGYDQLALGLWELCHEMGHAVNFILSSSSREHLQGFVDTQAAKQQETIGAGLAGEVGLAAAPPGALQADAPHIGSLQPFHLHASWLPLELLELPSTLFEVFVMDTLTLQLLCTHRQTGHPLPEAAAAKLARFMQQAHYDPMLHQSRVLAMLYDLELCSISSKQLGQHSAHHLWRCINEDLSEVPAVDATLQQLAVIPRLLRSSGQGYGYAVAWVLAQLLQPVMLQHIRRAQECALHAASVVRQTSSATHTVAGCEADITSCQMHWMQLLSAGAGLADVKLLAACIIDLLQHSPGGKETNSAHVVSMLHQQGLWPVERSDPQKLLWSLLRCSLDHVQSAHGA